MSLLRSICMGGVPRNRTGLVTNRHDIAQRRNLQPLTIRQRIAHLFRTKVVLFNLSYSWFGLLNRGRKKAHTSSTLCG